MLLSEKEIPAGGEGKIEVKLHINRVRKGMEQMPVVETVKVKCNDPEKKIVRLTVKATAVRSQKRLK